MPIGTEYDILYIEMLLQLGRETNNMKNPFRSQLWQDTIRENNKLTAHEFMFSMNDVNGTHVKLDEINEMIQCGILTVDYDKLEQRIYNKSVVTQ